MLIQQGLGEGRRSDRRIQRRRKDIAREISASDLF